MDEKEQKQIARKRRERRLRGWLTTLSWSTPVIAFGGFFSIWHHISSAVNATPTTVAKVTSQQAVKSDPSVLFKVGSSSPQIKGIQQELNQLGYFHHPITNYYGFVTAGAVRAFQSDNQLTPTGEIDSVTLNALQQAVKDNQTTSLTDQNQNSSNQTDGASSSSNSFGSSSANQGNSGISQSTNQPAVISSAS